MTFITLAVITALCLVLPTTRIYAVIGTGLLFYFHPYYTIGVLLVMGIAFFYFRKHRRQSNAL